MVISFVVPLSLSLSVFKRIRIFNFPQNFPRIIFRHGLVERKEEELPFVLLGSREEKEKKSFVLDELHSSIKYFLPPSLA